MGFMHKQKMEQPSVSIIVVNYNGTEDTLECLESIQNVDYQNYRIILIDNASRYFPEDRIKERFPETILIRNHKNLGFTGGNNVGLEMTYKLGSEYVFFLNNDTIVSTNILSELVSFMREHKEVGLLGPISFFYDDPKSIEFAGGRINRNTGLITKFYRDMAIEAVKEKVIYCNFIQGSALFMRADTMKKVGGFNDIYFLTSEESELCIRISDMGYKMAILTTCFIMHKVSRSMGVASQLSTYFVYRNKLIFVKRNAINIRPTDLYEICKAYIRSLLSFLIKKRNVEAAKGIITGVYDFFSGNFGQGRYGD